MLTRRFLTLCFSAAVGSAALVVSTVAQAHPVRLTTTPAEQTLTTTIVFDVRHPEKLKRYIAETVTPGGPHYRDFLSLHSFVAHYAPAPGQILKVEHYLARFGITTKKVFDDHLAITVSGPASGFNQAFNVTLGNFEETKPGPHKRHFFHRPNRQPSLPALLRDNDVMTVVGLSNQFQYAPMHMAKAPLRNDQAGPALPQGNSTATGVPGNYTVGEVANLYNVNPLYEEGIAGSGTTVGVATYANFQPEDAYTYWNFIGLTYKPDRITQVHVDGGGELGSSAGTGETSLDVEQSGGLAPNADIVVYDAPNSDQGGIDLFYRIVSDNKVDSLSYSWGQPEIFYFPQLNGGVDYRSELQSLNQAFMEAAVQGISLFAASGDSGAYDIARSLPPPYFSTPLTVDAPASSPYITAAGGTTVPFSAQFHCGPVTVPTERAWGWDYLADYLHNECGDPTGVAASSVFPVGDGGGVSVYWPRPWYQQGISGMRNSEPGQSLIAYYVDPPYDFIDLPAGFHGRNVPDISMNADPETGYLVYSTVDGGLLNYFGGTSFVAPQLNGITALINQRAGGRIGLLNPQLYRLLKTDGYGSGSPFNDITAGNNWYYHGVSGYDPATGVGTPNVARLAEALAGHH